MSAAIAIGVLLALVTTLPLAWKWQLGLARAATAVAALAALAAALVAVAGALWPLGTVVAAALAWLLTCVFAVVAVAYRFYRDPPRNVPNRDDLVLSPADGKVVYVREARAGKLPVSSKRGRDYALEELTKTPFAARDAVVVGVSLSFLDVHVNRSPVRGRIVFQRRFPGRFGSLRDPEMVFENERTTLVIDRGDLQVAVVLIASRLVRRIVSFLREGSEVAAGERIGMIRFGSQADVVLPLRDDLRIVVREGDRLLAGETAIAELQQVAPAQVPPDRDGSRADAARASPA
jgi:phosphatidylserine decarboxylase